MTIRPTAKSSGAKGELTCARPRTTALEVPHWMPERDSKQRFTERVDAYQRARPDYPDSVARLVLQGLGLPMNASVADIGCGTGLSSVPFLRAGCRVVGVEPNDAMRAAGAQWLAAESRFSAHFSVVAGSAEATTLKRASADIVCAGQAFHWFDRAKTREEFVRILKVDGWVVVAWNGYRVKSSPLMSAYQELVVRYGADYSEVQREVEDCDVESFCDPATCTCTRFEFQQSFDYEGLKGRFLSASFVPGPDHPDYEAMLKDLRKVFEANQKDGTVIFAYETVLYYGQLSGK